MANYKLAGSSATISENTSLQLWGDAFDLELLQGNAAGFTLTIGGVASGETVGLIAGNGLTFDGGIVKLNGVTVGIAVGGNGSDFVVSLVGGADADDLAEIVHRLGYATSSDNPPASRSLSIALTDAGGQPVGNLESSTFEAVVGINNPFNGLDVGTVDAKHTLSFVDIDGDGDRDMVVSANQITNPELYRNQAGAFVFTRTDPFFEAVRSLSFGDFDGDGRVDTIAAVGASDPNIAYNEGTSATPDYSGGSSPASSDIPQIM